MVFKVAEGTMPRGSRVGMTGALPVPHPHLGSCGITVKLIPTSEQCASVEECFTHGLELQI